MWCFHFTGVVGDEIRMSSDRFMLSLFLIVFDEFSFIVFFLTIGQRLRHQIDNKASILNGTLLIGLHFLTCYALASEIIV